MAPVAWIWDSLLELIYPERCVLCGAVRGEAPWTLRGGPVPGLRCWDGTHLCADCDLGLDAKVAMGQVGEGHPGALDILAAARTNPDLVHLVGQFKYHGLRGLAWPLARLISRPWGRWTAGPGGADALVPIPLHRRRRRVRGFNQAELLARLAGVATGVPVLPGILSRRRNTGQQARITSPEARRRNLEDSFRAPSPAVQGRPQEGRPVRICLVDDLVTSGWTVVSAAACLRAAGWVVTGGLSLGLAPPARMSGVRVDTWQGGF